jgi:hypothetical protein
MTKEYQITFIVTDDTDLKVKSCNEGFSTIELIGLLQMKIFDLQQQQWGVVAPNIERIAKVKV